MIIIRLKLLTYSLYEESDECCIYYAGVECITHGQNVCYSLPAQPGPEAPQLLQLTHFRSALITGKPTEARRCAGVINLAHTRYLRLLTTAGRNEQTNTFLSSMHNVVHFRKNDISYPVNYIIKKI